MRRPERRWRCAERGGVERVARWLRPAGPEFTFRFVVVSSRRDPTGPRAFDLGRLDVVAPDLDRDAFDFVLLARLSGFLEFFRGSLRPARVPPAVFLEFAIGEQ